MAGQVGNVSVLIPLTNRLSFTEMSNPFRWPLTFTPGILGATTVMSSIYINSHYRSKLKLGNYGRLSSYIPAVVLPAIMTTFFHKSFIVPDVVLNTRQCAVCVQTRAGLLQAGFSTAYPMLLAPMSAFMVCIFCQYEPDQGSHDYHISF